MNNPTFYTLGTASKALGVTKPTVRKWIDDGDLPATRNDKGHFQIQRVDLERLYPEKLHEVESKHQADTKTLQSLPPNNDTTLQALTTAHEATIKALEAVITEKEARADEYKRQAEKWEGMANNFLEDKRTEAEKAQSALDAEKAKRPKVTRRKVGFFERLRIKEVVEVEEVA